MNGLPELDFILNEKNIRVRALFIAEKIDTKSLEKTKLISKSPMVITAGARGCAAIFKYGSVVLMNLTSTEEAVFISDISEFLTNPLDNPKFEELVVEIRPDLPEQSQGSTVFLSELKLEHILLLAEVLARSVVLDYYESVVARSFELIEPFAKALKQTESLFRFPDTKQLLRHIGTVLLDQHNMAGRVEVIEKPDLLWDNPQMERFFFRMMDEYDIRERHGSLERKLALIGSTAETVLDIIQTRRNIRLEWYIIILIIIEILWSIYEFIL